MADIFARQRTGFGGSFASDVAALTLAGTTTPLGIVQNVGITFNQQIARIYDVSNGGSAGWSGGLVPVFYVGGRTQGQASIARVLGPQSGALAQFYTQMGNVCTPQDLTFTFRGGCSDSGAGGGTAAKQLPFSNAVGSANFNAAVYTVEAAVAVGMQVNVGATDMIVNESISLMFANLKCTEGNVAA